MRLRWMFIIAVAVLLAAERVYAGSFARPPALVLCIVTLALVNTLWMILGRGFVGGTGSDQVPTAIHRMRVLAIVQINVDLLLLTAILRYSGGIENPMVLVYLIHMMIATLLLRPISALLQGLWILVLYGGLLAGECTGLVTPHFPLFPPLADLGVHREWRLVVANIGVLAVAIFVMLHSTLRVCSHLEKQQREVHSANETLRNTQAALKDLQVRQSRLLQTAAHQLKSPLAGIETLAGLIRDKVVPAEGVPEIIERIIGRCRQAVVQVMDVLTLARLGDSGPARQHSVRMSVRRTVERVAARFTEQVVMGGLTLHVHGGDSDSATIAVAPSDFEDCIANLLDNAIKYTSRGGTIWVTVTRERDAISISVKDTGIGIAEDSLDNIFDPFRRGNLALVANIPGTGLGLSIVREVVEQAGGRISVRSSAGKGSEFVVSFPRRGGPEPLQEGLEQTDSEA